MKNLCVTHKKVLDSDTYYLVYYVHNGERDEQRNNRYSPCNQSTHREIELNEQEMELGLYKSVTGEEKWDTMCALVLERTGIEIIGQIQIDYMVVDGNKHVFH